MESRKKKDKEFSFPLPPPINDVGQLGMDSKGMLMGPPKERKPLTFGSIPQNVVTVDSVTGVPSGGEFGKHVGHKQYTDAEMREETREETDDAYT